MNGYFNALTDLFLLNSYPSNAIFNVDETGFALGIIRLLLRLQKT
jgi:hypothetical protein